MIGGGGTQIRLIQIIFGGVEKSNMELLKINSVY